MKITTLRLPESMYEAIEAEAEDRELSPSEYMRLVLRNRESALGNTQEKTQENIQENTNADLADLRDRVAAVEERLGQLEAGGGGGKNVADDDFTTGGEPALAFEDTSARAETEVDTSADGDLPDALVDDSNDPYAVANAKAVGLLRRAPSHVPKSKILDHVADDLEISPGSWWERHGRPALQDAGANYVRNRGWTVDE